MQSNKQTTFRSGALTGRIISAIVILFLLFDSVIKLIRIDPVVESFIDLGYSADLARPIGLVELICVVIYIIPRTSVPGLILLTGFLGGATAAKVRLEDPWFLFSIGIALLLWAGTYLRDERFRSLIALQK